MRISWDNNFSNVPKKGLLGIIKILLKNRYFRDKLFFTNWSVKNTARIVISPGWFADQPELATCKYVHFYFEKNELINGVRF